MPFLHCTSRTAGEPHPDLLTELGFTGFPALAFLDAEGKVLARVDFEQRSVEAFRTIAEGVQSYRAMRAALADDGGEPDVHMRAELLLAEARLRRWSFQELDARMRSFGTTLPAAHKAQLAPLRSTLEFDWLSRLRDITPREKADRLKVFWRERRVPAGRRELFFWLEYGAAGKAVEDPTMLDLAAEVLESRADTPSGVAAAYRKQAEELRRR